ncbi:MAG TPA: FAD-dependent oxidoreductase, partial [Sphingomicrobium sp.]|nr:FAD-dependent oxidoreductase [Sphingomicrobium sp.]
MAQFDVIIVGGGIAGASLGAELAASARVTLIEGEAQCGAHATGRSAAFWLESYGGPLVAPLTAASRDFLERPPADFSDQGFLRPRGALHISRAGWPDIPSGVDVRVVERAELEVLVPGIRPEWRNAMLEPGCADIDVAALHSAYLRQLRRRGGLVLTGARLESARRDSGGIWSVMLENGETVAGSVLVNAAGAWADDVARRAGVKPLGIAPKRRTMVQLAVGRDGLKQMPLVGDAEGTFYFKGEGDSSIWLSPHDEIETDPCDAAPDEIDVATAIDRFEHVVDWPVLRVERRWAGLRSFAPDRVPVFGFDPREPGLFWCAGQGGFGIQTAPAAAKLAASLLLGEP